MFSTNQLIFGVCFFVAFVIFMIFSYRKDTQIHNKHYKGSFWVVIFFVCFIALLFGLKVFLKF